MDVSKWLNKTIEQMRMVAEVQSSDYHKNTLKAFALDTEKAKNDVVELENLLREWMVFSGDVQASDAAGEDWLNSLKRRTKNFLS